MRIDFYGSDYDLLDGAFYDFENETFDVELVSATRTEITLESSLGYITTLNGSGLVVTEEDSDLQGTLSSIEFRDDANHLIAVISQINWGLAEFIGALDGIYSDDGDDSALIALLERNGEITVNTSQATQETELYLDIVSVPVTFVGGSQDDLLDAGSGNDELRGGAGDDVLAGGPGEDMLYGGPGNDYLDPGDSMGTDEIDPGTGDDIIDAQGMSDGYLEIAHQGLVGAGNGMVFNIDGQADTAMIRKGGGNGTTEILGVSDAMEADGLGLEGTASNDTFNVTVTDEGWVSLKGGQGNDTFNLGPSWGTVRLDYQTDNAGNDPTQGLRINLATGTVSNDGFGGTDTIATAVAAVGTDTIEPYGPVLLEVRGTQNADVMIGGMEDDRFITAGGNDTVDGGEGWDLLRYDQGGATGAVAVDLAAGTAMGSWGGVGFTQSISNIEAVRGTRDFGDMLSGSDAGESFFGRGGDDALFGDGFEASYTMDESATVYRLYQATLDRAPDLGGLFDWSERLFSGESTLLEVTNGFVGSREFQNTYGALDNEGFVTLLYQNVLEREPDADGLSNWVSQLETGMTRAEVVRGFAESGEFVRDTRAEATSFITDSTQASWSDDVYRLYQATLDRAPDLSGFDNWTGQLAEGRSFLSAIEGFTESREFLNTYGTLGNEGFVDLLYRNVLDRAADADGLADWTSRLDAGLSRAEVVRGFAQSTEFTNSTAADLKDWMRGLDLGTGDDYHDWLNGEEGDNLLAGGLYADVFEFEQGNGGAHRVADLEAWDYVAFGDFGYAGTEDALANMTQSGADVLFEDQGVSITFSGTQLASISDDMILV